ncbi:hypothetical protein [Robertmurraya andreesenii]|uniref:Uncharacterized protein n=1 Tax=Anoxybacillus andreesenii TaxID=1325932 RepID=A0ABT9V1E6_9BACL|nr:hypothetical protein [Robertmurraya andreesenii]MDQ0154775.1 hypothetical protein [Robertmurraya andreesenii]
MRNGNPVEFTGKVLDKRNTLTGPDDNGKATCPNTTNRRIPIQEQNSEKPQ